MSGTCHQGYPYFADRFTGRQCIVTAVVAPCFAMLKRRTIWQTRDADGILAEDHQKYI